MTPGLRFLLQQFSPSLSPSIQRGCLKQLENMSSHGVNDSGEKVAREQAQEQSTARERTGWLVLDGLRSATSERCRRNQQQCNLQQHRKKIMSTSETMSEKASLPSPLREQPVMGTLSLGSSRGPAPGPFAASSF
jgi:hypothetical protein